MSHRKNPIPTPVSLSPRERGWGEGRNPIVHAFQPRPPPVDAA